MSLLFFYLYRLHNKMLDAPPRPNSFNFMQFLGRFGKIVCWRPREGWRPHVGEILDPPLHSQQISKKIAHSLLESIVQCEPTLSTEWSVWTGRERGGRLDQWIRKIKSEKPRDLMCQNTDYGMESSAGYLTSVTKSAADCCHHTDGCFHRIFGGSLESP